MGLFDSAFGSGLNDPQTMGLLSAAAQMLGASGPSRTPTSFGQVLGTGMLGGLQGFQQAQDRQRENKMYDMKLKTLEEEMSDKQKVRDFYGNIGQFMPSQASQALSAGAKLGDIGPTVTNAARIDQMPKQAFNSSAMYEAMLRSGSPTLAAAGLSGLSKEDDSIVVGEGGALVNKRTGQQLYNNEKKEKPLEIERMLDAAGITDPMARANFLRQAITKQTTHAPGTSVNVMNAGPKAFETELGKLDAEQLKALRDTAQTAQSVMGVIKNLRAAESAGTYAGGGADAKTTVGNLVYGLTGAEPKGLYGSQVYNAEVSKLILDRVKALGANPSNADREFIEKTVPQLSMSRKARETLSNWMEQKAAQQVDLFRRADEYARKNHGFGGFNFVEDGGEVDVDALVKKYAPKGK